MDIIYASVRASDAVSVGTALSRRKQPLQPCLHDLLPVPQKASLAQGSEGPNCVSGCDNLPRGWRGVSQWGEAWSQEWPRPLRDVTSPCRSVPRAWWMKTPSNSFIPSSSPREVSSRPGSPTPGSHDYTPLLGRVPYDHPYLPRHPFLFGEPDIASDLPERNPH